MTRMLCSVSTWIGVFVGSWSRGSLGQPTLPLRQLYVPAVLELLSIGACHLQARGLVDSSMSENRISALLDEHMRAARITTDTSDILSWFMRPLIPTISGPSPSLVEPDFLFVWGPYPSREDPSLVVEAKRLRGSGPSLAGDYVDEGVMRFADGSYGQGHDYGVMMGYVIAAPLAGAISSVGAAMSVRKNATQQLERLAPNTSLCVDPSTHHSTHLQKGSARSITLVHIFIDFS